MSPVETERDKLGVITRHPATITGRQSTKWELRSAD